MIHKPCSTSLVTFAVAAVFAGGSAAQAQDYPNRPIRVVVPFSAGGAVDGPMRAIAQELGKRLKQQVIIDNKPGAGATIGSEMVAKSPPDGYTLLQGYVATHGTSPATRSKLPYDAIKDFTPVGMIGGTPNVLVVNAALPPQNIQQFLAYLRANPARVSYGSAGQGSLTHLTMELMKDAAKVFAVHIPYRGVAPAFNDLLGGQTQAMFPGLAAALPHIRSGRVRALAVTGQSRHPLLKDVPTMIEAGFKGFDALQWYGVVGPAGLPAPVLKTLNDTLNAVLAAPDLRDKLAAEAVEPQPMAPDAFGRFIREDIARWTALARERKIDLDA